jgi:uncharacterized membrane protein
VKNRYFLICALVVLATLVAGIILYPQLPIRVATHWDLHGRVNGYSSRAGALFVMPCIMAGILLLFAALPSLSPRRFEVDSFRSTYLYLMMVIVVCMAYFHAVVLWAAMSPGINLNRAIFGGICVLFTLMGNVMGKIKRNFFVGVRTPWTLASEPVWYATHRLAAKVFFWGGVIGLVLTLFLPRFLVPLLLVLVACGLIPVAYSFVYYKRLERQGVEL